MFPDFRSFLTWTETFQSYPLRFRSFEAWTETLISISISFFLKSRKYNEGAEAGQMSSNESSSQ